MKKPGYKISQSLIKDVSNICCKYYFDLKYEKGLQNEPTTAMQKGLYFESELLGSARGGKYEFPKLKNGSKSKVEKDIDIVIDLAKKVLNNSNIRIDNVQLEITKDDLNGHIDFMSDKIYDVKYTGESFDRWNKSFIYDWKNHFEIQSRHYQLIEGNKKDFVFLIFSEKLWFRAILYPFDEQAIDEHLLKIEQAKMKIHDLDEPTSTMCATCPFNNICQNRVLQLDFENINDLIY